MVPHMAATVLSSPVFVLFLLVCPSFLFLKKGSVFPGMNCWIFGRTPQNRLPDFHYSDILQDIVVSGAAALFRRYRMRRQGKSHGGRTLFYIKERRCTDGTVLKKMCCSDLKTLHKRQAILFAAGVLLVHSRVCLHSSASARGLSFT